MARVRPAAGPQPDGPAVDRADAAEQRASERETLAQKAAWLRAQADTVATVEPRLRNAVDAAAKASTQPTAGELRSLGETARRAIASAREAVEHLASDLEHTATRPRSDDDPAGPTPLARASDDDGVAPSFAEVVRLVDDVAGDLPGDSARRCRARLPKASPSELTLLADLVDTGLTHDQLLRLLEGGHLLLPGHHLLKRWRRLPGVKPRTSSHYHPDDRRIGRGPEWVEAARARLDDAHAHPIYGQQYGLKGRFVHEALFGPGPHHTTFVQLERAAPSKLHLVRHIADWVRYRLTRRNQGPYGSSLDTDHHPMRGVVWWKPAKRSAPAQRLDASAHEVDDLVGELLDVGKQLDAQGRLRSMVWRGPTSAPFDEAVDGAIADLTRAAAATGAFGARVRREARAA